jgi:hypothetical protein
VPVSCVDGLSCADAADEYGYASCADEGQVCGCEAGAEDTVSFAGQWQIDELGILTVTGGDQQWATSDFCAEDGHLALSTLQVLGFEIPGALPALELQLVGFPQ